MVGVIPIPLSEDSFLYSPFSKISPQCNIPIGNQRDEFWGFDLFFISRAFREETSWQAMFSLKFNILHCRCACFFVESIIPNKCEEIIAYTDDDCPDGIDEPDWEPQGILDGSVLLWIICR